MNVNLAVTLNTTLDVTGPTSVSTFGSTGSTSIATSEGSVNISKAGNTTTVKGLLDVKEAVAIDSTLNVNDDTTINGSLTLSTDDPTDDNHATRKKYVDDEVSKISTLQISADTGGNDTLQLGGDTFTISGGTGIESTVSDSQVSLGLSDTGIDVGSYGSSTEVPIFSVDAQGRLTEASTATIASTLAVDADNSEAKNVSLLTDSLKFLGTVNEIETEVTKDVNDIKITIGLPDDVTISEDLTVNNTVSIG